MGVKLVRDRMGEIPWGDENAKKYLRPVKNKDEHIRLLYQKLLEELGELLACDEPTDAVEEIADIQEVLEALTDILEKDPDVSPGWAHDAKVRKYAERGGFDKGLVWDRDAYLG